MACTNLEKKESGIHIRVCLEVLKLHSGAHLLQTLLIVVHGSRIIMCCWGITFMNLYDRKDELSYAAPHRWWPLEQLFGHVRVIMRARSHSSHFPKWWLSFVEVSSWRTVPCPADVQLDDLSHPGGWIVPIRSHDARTSRLSYGNGHRSVTTVICHGSHLAC